MTDTFIHFACPQCAAVYNAFRISAGSKNVTLQVTCEPCKTVVEITLTYDEFQRAGTGKPVCLAPVETFPKYVM